MKQKLTFVLSGGGAYGALQVGALRVLWEHQIRPDLLVGTSIGSVNAAFVALNGFTAETMDALDRAWLGITHSEILTNNMVWLGLRAMFGQPDGETQNKAKNLFIQYGLTPKKTFRDIDRNMELVMVAADLNNGSPVVFDSATPDLPLLEGVMASTALPPWIRPIEEDGQYRVDGGFVSNLPIESAIDHGATLIIALDLADPMAILGAKNNSKPFLSKVIQTTIWRQRMLELRLAEAYNIPVLNVSLSADKDQPLWDFSRTPHLIEHGYKLMSRVLAENEHLEWLKPDNAIHLLDTAST